MGECAEETFHFLLTSSAYSDTLRWSEDNQLAVSGKYESVLLDATDYTAPKGIASFDVNSHIAYTVDAVPKWMQYNLQYFSRLLDDKCSAGKERQVDRVSVRSLAWSPAGATPTATCLLAMVTADGQVREAYKCALQQNLAYRWLPVSKCLWLFLIASSAGQELSSFYKLNYAVGDNKK